MTFQTPEFNPPAVNLPRCIIVLTIILVGIHTILELNLLPFIREDTIVLNFAYIPYFANNYWTYISYAFLHGSWTHLFVNIVWMLAFGAAVAWRFGNTRFLLYSAVCAIAGALFHLITHIGEIIPTIGASAVISGHMAGAIRFISLTGGPLGGFRGASPTKYKVPSMSLKEAFSNPQILIFLAVWFGVNLVLGIAGSALTAGGGGIAWQAHIGGFLAGLLLFDFFDPIGKKDRFTGYGEF